jgi:radical SAM protein with 4Fe4S-binding SPASM domain
MEKLKNDKIYQKLINDFPSRGIMVSYFDWSGLISQEDLPPGANLLVKDNTKEKVDCTVCNATLSITPEGKAIGCGCIDFNSKYIIGDCSEDNLLNIWKNKRALSFRRSFHEGHIPEMCKKCALYLNVKNAYSRRQLLNYKVTDGLYFNI